MKTTPIDQIESRPRKVALGTFDGVHLGHRAVIGAADTVVTFDPHPVTVVAPDRVPRLLTTIGQKAGLLSELGVRELVVVPFDERTAAMTPQEFVDEILVEALQATEVRVGENFRFGKGAAGDTVLLGQQAGFETTVVPLLERDGRVVSSSWIRELVGEGQVAAASELLGHEFELLGPVVEGEKRGRELGYPTANLVPTPGYCLPAHGVYAATATLEGGEEVPAAVSIGLRPTFQTELGELIEAYLIDFDGDLYGQELALRFRSHLRPELRFEDAEALIGQMATDVADARAALADG